MMMCRDPSLDRRPVEFFGCRGQNLVGPKHLEAEDSHGAKCRNRWFIGKGQNSKSYLPA